MARCWAAVVLAVALSVAARADPLRWTDVAATPGLLYGRGFDPSELMSPYDRLPAAAHGVVRDEVWSLSRGWSKAMEEINERGI